MLCPASREVHEQANPPIPACSCVMQETHRLGCAYGMLPWKDTRMTNGDSFIPSPSFPQSTHAGQCLIGTSSCNFSFCLAVIHLLLAGCQRGQPISRRESGVVTLSTEILNLWTHAEVMGGRGCGLAVCSWSCSEF